MAERVCAKCGHKESQHLTAPMMCADCARENRDGAMHAFAPKEFVTRRPDG